MKLRVLALLLLLATLSGVFGCSVKSEQTDDLIADDAPQFIGGGKSDALSDVHTAERPEKLLNFTMLNEMGIPAFRIVRLEGASLAIKDACDAFSATIEEKTGISIPVVCTGFDKKPYEILVLTSHYARNEVAEYIDGLSLEDHQFAIKVIGTKVLVYGKTEYAVLLGLEYLAETLAYCNEETGEFGLAEDYEFIYDGFAPTSVVVSQTSEEYVEIVQTNEFGASEYARLSFTGNSGWRIQTKQKETDVYDDFGAAQRLAYSLGETDRSRIEPITTAATENNCLVLASDGSYVNINTEPFRINFYTPSDRLAASVTKLSESAGGGVIAGVLEEDEAIFGTGERFNSANQRGKYIDMFAKDLWNRADTSYMVIPLLCSSRGSGIFVNLYERMTLDLGNSVADEWKFVTNDNVSLDVYFYTTDEIADVIHAYSDLTGYAGMPEEWTYGMIVCTTNPELSQKWSGDITPAEDGRGEGVYELIAKMEEYDLPWNGVIVEAWGPYKNEKHKDLKELCDYVHSLGKKLIVYQEIGAVSQTMTTGEALSSFPVGAFDTSYYLYQKQPTRNTYMLPQIDFSNNNCGGLGTRVYLDITNPDAVNWYFNEYWTYLMNDIGVDGCKIDLCEQLPENYELLYYDKTMPTEGSHHWYPSAFCAMFWDMIAAKPDSGMCYTRGGGIGAQRAPYMWAGDQTREYQSLGRQLTAVLSSGLSGVPFMSYDMSGYHDGHKDTTNELAFESQVFLRGAQFTAYTACMQTNGKVRRAYQFAEEDPNYAYVTDIYRAYVKLHEHLTPYITELCEEASTTGMPVMRHLILGWQDDKNVYGIEDEYTFGDAFLIAPILDETYTRNIYLPEGEWVDLNTGEEYSVGADGMWLESYEASIAELPTFYNKNTESEIAPTLVDGIMEIYDYARSVAP